MARLIPEHFTRKGSPKRGFATREDALAAIRPGPAADNLNPYRCEVCRQWHLGNL